MSDAAPHPVAAWLAGQNLTQRDFAKQMDVSETALSRLLSGRANRLNPDACLRVATATGIPLETLVAHNAVERIAPRPAVAVLRKSAEEDRVSDARVGGRILRAIRARGLTQAEVSRQTGISAVTLNRFTKGRQTAAPDELAAIAAALGVSVSEFCSGTGPTFAAPANPADPDAFAESLSHDQLLLFLAALRTEAKRRADGLATALKEAP